MHLHWQLSSMASDVEDIDRFVRFGVDHDDFDVAAGNRDGMCEVVEQAGAIFGDDFD